MKQTAIITVAAIGLLLNAVSAAASKDDEYPAAYFQPKVVYIDKEAAKESSTMAMKTKRKVVFDPKYPAAYFEPKVIYP